MTAIAPEPVRLAEALRGLEERLGGARFIGRHPSQPTDDSFERWYHDPEDAARRYQSATWTIAASEWAPWLPTWAAKLSAEQTRDHWADLGEMASAIGWDAAVRWLREEARRQYELAAEVGTWLHDVLEALLLDRSIPDPRAWMLGRRLTTGGEDIIITRETLDRWADGLLAFLQDYRVEPVMSEATVCNPEEGYATRVDLWAYLPGYGLVAIDLKSGRVKQSAIAQLTAAVHATEVWLPLGGKVVAPRCDRAAVLHLRQIWERGYKLRPVPTGPEQWEWFRTANRILQIRQEQPDVDRLVMYPPEFGPGGEVVRIPTIPMVEDAGLRCARVLREAGITWLHEVAEFEVGDLLSVRPTKRRPESGVKGVGPVAIDQLRVLLAEHGLTFADEVPREGAVA